MTTSVKVYVLTKNGKEITEKGRKIVRDAVIKNTKVNTVDLHGGVVYNDPKHLAKILTDRDTIGISIPEKSECFFVSDTDSIKSFREVLQNSTGQTSWQVAVDFIEK